MSKIRIEKIVKDVLNVGKRVPIRRWSENWTLPDKVRIEKYFVRMINSGKESIVERYRLVGRMGKEIPKAKKWYKGNENRAGLKYYIESDYVWCILRNSFPTNIQIETCRLENDEKWLYLVLPDNYIGIWYEERINNINFAICPEELELNDLFWQSMGILFGEMRKEETIEIVNNEPVVINTLVKWFNESKIIPKEEWTFSININSKNVLTEEKSNILENSKKFWSYMLKLPIEKIKSVHFYDQFNSTVVPNLGMVKISFTHECTRRLIDSLFGFVKSNVIKDENFAISFIQGLFAAEGDICIYKNRITMLRISSKYLEERKFYEQVLKTAKINAKASIKTHSVRITGIWNILRCLGIDITKLHHSRKERLIEGISRTMTFKALFLLFDGKLKVKEIVKMLNLTDYHNVNKNFHYLINHGYLCRIKTSEGYLYSVPKRTKSLLSPFYIPQRNQFTDLH